MYPQNDHAYNIYRRRNALLPIMDPDVQMQDEETERIKLCNDIIMFNVGGKRHQILRSNFAYWPTTRLSRLIRANTEDEILKHCDGYSTAVENAQVEYFFARNWNNFNSILGMSYHDARHHDFRNVLSTFVLNVQNLIITSSYLPDLYRNSKLHSNTHVCCMIFHEDLEYWGIDKLLLDACCAIKHYPEMEMRHKECERSKKRMAREEERRGDEIAAQSKLSEVRKMIWNFMESEDPQDQKSRNCYQFKSAPRRSPGELNAEPDLA